MLPFTRSHLFRRCPLVDCLLIEALLNDVCLLVLISVLETSFIQQTGAENKNSETHTFLSDSIMAQQRNSSESRCTTQRQTE